jgi:hypothetical protein
MEAADVERRAGLDDEALHKRAQLVRPVVLVLLWHAQEAEHSLEFGQV